jgi:hypothetical protein
LIGGVRAERLSSMAGTVEGGSRSGTRVPSELNLAGIRRPGVAQDLACVGDARASRR